MGYLSLLVGWWDIKAYYWVGGILKLIGELVGYLNVGGILETI